MTEEKNNAKFEQVSGKVKETLGNVSDNEKMKSEGQAEQVKGKVKETIEDVKDAVEGFKKGLSDKQDPQ